MPDFWSLPRDVRDKIYRLHLVKDRPIDLVFHEKLTRSDPRDTRRTYLPRRMPAICLVSTRAEREAAGIYYGENHFVFGLTKSGRDSRVLTFAAETWTRHLRLIRQVTYQWADPYSWVGPGFGFAGESFTEISRFKNLKELNIRVDENAMIRRMLVSRRHVQCSPRRPMTLQDGVALLRHPGMNGLLKMSGIPAVNFIKAFDGSDTEMGGPIPGGYLETVIRPRLQAAEEGVTRSRVKGGFDFLSLPPELRNRIYALLLTFDGPIHPSTKPPSSERKGRGRNSTPDHGSGLNILATNHHIHDEAYGIFYDSNSFEFYYPIQLHAFVLNLGHQRLSMIKDITVQYHNVKSGGVDLAEISIPTIKQLTSLRKLHIMFVSRNLLNRTLIVGWYRPGRYGVKNANPLTLPGMKSLFDLRGINDITIRDIDLERELKDIKEDTRYPDRFGDDSRERAYLDLERVLGHLNAALAQAQVGKVNFEMLEDDRWHMRDEFPEIVEEDNDAEGEDEASDRPELDSAGSMDIDRDGEVPATRLDTADDLQGSDDPIEDDEADTGRRYNLRSCTKQGDPTARGGSNGIDESTAVESDSEIVTKPRRSARLRKNGTASRETSINNFTGTTGNEADNGLIMANHESGEDNPAPGDHAARPSSGKAEASTDYNEGDEIVVSHARSAKAATAGVAPLSDFAKLMRAFEHKSGGAAAAGEEDVNEELSDDGDEQSYWAREPSVEL